MVPPTTQSISTPTETLPLRRATYVHVSDLISAYNIDHIQLEREISRVNAKRSRKLLRESSSDDPTSSDGMEKPSLALTSEGIDSGTRDGSSDGVPAPDEDADLEGPIVPQKRLQPPRVGFNLCVLVGGINLVVDKHRVDHSRVRLAEVEIGDETGTVSLRARDEQIDLLERVRSKAKPRAVVLRNCTLELYQGKHIRLAITKWGKLTEYPDNVASTPGPPPTMNLDRNFSFIDLSLVASQIVEKDPSDSLPYASAVSATTANRQSKKSDARANKLALSSTNKSATQSKQGQSNAKQQQQQQQQQQQHQQHQTSRRSSRLSSSEQRRQTRNAPQYGGLKVVTTQTPRSGHVMYHGIQGYHGYGEQSMDMHMRQQYPPHASYMHSHMHSQSSRQQDAVSAQLALQQQYEMQQRQLQQLYQSRQTSHLHHPQSPPMVLRHMSSFDASTGSYAGDISMSSDIGNSPSLVPPPDHYSMSPKMANDPGLNQEDSQSTGYPSLGTMSPYRIGKMNPEASSFAPSYLSAAQGLNSRQQVPTVPGTPQYPSYDTSELQPQQQPLPGASMYPTLQSAHHPPFYMQAALSPGAYHHTISRTGFNASIEQGLDGKSDSVATASSTSRNQHQYPYPSAIPTDKDSTSSSGKENITSKP
eukprot:CAMPEP_0116140740 /NCGR_PEP_ID=MMETSP0329-20121206/14016_1 /TAXON_ID=697910 /ORGANISM="Pseudo-nitzschia arenysensis, Strain B593" /LENGTH=645 /DNA_ID=CAMNT_0003635889 /DNA_START=420 /DNA_END=2357 /DNA_ORIENTATION=-